jgi:hypothetical protein
MASLFWKYGEQDVEIKTFYPLAILASAIQDNTTENQGNEVWVGYLPQREAGAALEWVQIQNPRKFLSSFFLSSLIRQLISLLLFFFLQL